MKRGRRFCSRISEARRTAFVPVKLGDQHGGSLIEIIGVLAILAIFAALILPRISGRNNTVARATNAVHEARVVQTLAEIQAIKSAIESHAAQSGSLAFPATSASNLPGGTDTHYDTLLVQKGFLSRPFNTKLGTRSVLRLVNVTGLSQSSTVYETPGAYDLDGDGRNDVVGVHYVVEALVFGVSKADAKALNDRLDGPAMGTGPAAANLTGKVIWNGGSPQAPREVHIYLTQGG